MGVVVAGTGSHLDASIVPQQILRLDDGRNAHPELAGKLRHARQAVAW